MTMAASTENLTTMANALFVSTLQPSDAPAIEQVEEAIVSCLRTYRATGCAVRAAAEYGEHPEEAASRMRWALSVVA
ncbi:MAG: hypothetical protein JWO79_389 [Actinomycetia bacterium]|jgi:hypothetical protein|nr:hypothetical protein [Actinomycetes bacterium]